MAEELLRAFQFRVALRRSGPGWPGAPEAIGDLGFQECTGLEVSVDVQEYLEGGRNDAVVRRVGRAKYEPLVLRRGMVHVDGAPRAELWEWVRGVVEGRRPVARYDGTVEVRSPDDRRVVARWAFARGLPLRLRGPELHARTGEIAIEELHIAHEGLTLAREVG